jgi:5,10-methenyltetrahydrofolate synthetase
VCYLHELDADGRPVDPVQARDVQRWRKVERERLLSERSALAVESRARQTQDMASELDAIVGSRSAPVVSVYWPIKAEPDLRPWMRALQDRAVRVALPVALVLGQPLKFREWRPGGGLARGIWNIPYPADGVEVVPTVTIAPLVGFDAHCYRLGYGGGFFDRTLATLSPKPIAIGVGYPTASIPTIFPQPHDVPMDWIVTGNGAPIRRE